MTNVLVQPSLRVLRELAKEAVNTRKKNFQDDWKINVQEMMPGIVVLVADWYEWTGMGRDYACETLFKGTEEEAFALLCRWANPKESNT